MTKVQKQSLHFDSLGDKHKKFEQIAESQLIDDVPLIARLDGRAFHTVTKKLNKPFDENFIKVMSTTAIELLKQFNAMVAYVQSDEITLIWDKPQHFNGRVQKLTSCLASYATSVFITNIMHDTILKEKINVLYPSFDSRIWQVPSLEVAAENLLWREMDASRNSINMMAHTYFSKSKTHGLSTKNRLQLLFEHGYDWNSLSSTLKRGSFFAKKSVKKLLSDEELQNIPVHHRPEGPVERNEIVCINVDVPLTRIINRVDFLFYGAEPQLLKT